MCKLKFRSDRDASMRLTGSIVMYKGKPVHVLEATVKKCLVVLVGKGDELRVNTDDLDLTPVQIGNIQIGAECLYVQRMPIRRWKQGLHRENLRVSSGPSSRRIPGMHINMTDKDMLNAIINKFGDAQENMAKVLSGQWASAALNRHWSVHNHKGIPRLMYKDKLVGFVDEGEITITKKFFFLKEDLLGVLNA